MDHPIFHKDRVLMRGDLRSLETAAPVDADIYDHTPGPHIAYHLVGYHYRRTSGLRGKCAYGDLTGLELFGKNTGLHHGGPHALPDIDLQSLQPVDTVVEYFDGGAQSQGRSCGKLAHDAGPQDNYLGRG